ncbi:MAG: hypothetical protein WD276_06500 [Actinomycetota bacterium]
MPTASGSRSRPISASSPTPARASALLGGLLAATCCIGPAIGFATGASAGSFLLAMGGYRPLLFAVGGFAAAAAVLAQVRKRRASCESRAAYRSLRSAWLTAAIVSFALTYAGGRFVLAPLIEALS